VVNHSQVFKPDIVITLQDIWTLNPDLIRQLNRFCPIVPVDHEPIPPAIYERLKLAYRIISYAPFGERELQRCGMHSTYIPHTVDTNLFVKSDKSEIRKKIGIPDDVFLFGMVAANKDNPPRKSFQEVLDAFKIFKSRHPKSAIYFHSIMNQPGGFPIDTYAKAIGIQDSVYFIGAYDLLNRVDTTDMPKIYSAFDCFLLPSTNEGFGVPAIEAQSCEVPTIVNDFTALRDLVIDNVTGYKTKVAYKRFTPLNSWIGIPDTNSLVEKMEKVYKTDREKMGKAGRKFVQDNFDIKVVWEKHWLPWLKRVEEEIYKN
jgi:glycosyltransferase involved in cell wall biosynthesis